MRRRLTMVVAAAFIGAAGWSMPGHAGDVPPPEKARVRLEGGKTRIPYLQRSEAGVALPLTGAVALQLHYERTALAPLMRTDHDDGVMARLRLGF